MDQHFGWIVGVVLLVATYGWLAAVAPPLVSFAAAAGIGAGWCRWLESHPDTRG